MPDNGCRRQQRYRVVALLLALPLFFPLTSHGGIFKCVATNGEITFSQTPCPKVEAKVPAEEDANEIALASNAPVPERPDDVKSAEKVAEPTEIALVRDLAQATPSPRIDTPVQHEKKPENSALLAQKQKSNARDEENRLQCEKNIKSQINSINTQMRNSSQSSSLVDSLQKKRRTLEGRLNDC